MSFELQPSSRSSATKMGNMSMSNGVDGINAFRVYFSIRYVLLGTLIFVHSPNSCTSQEIKSIDTHHPEIFCLRFAMRTSDTATVALTIPAIIITLKGDVVGVVTEPTG